MPDIVMMLVGFTAGQVQLIDPIKKELSKLYNEEVLIKILLKCDFLLLDEIFQKLLLHH